MNSLIVAIFAVLLLGCGFKFYGKIMEKLWDINPQRKTPAVEMTDGVDYIPARHWTILFGHHFASIAGAGPIIGPVIAVAIWGWVPALIWIVIGSIFIGGVHDFSCLVGSIRHKGRSIGDVAESALSHRAKMIFATFLWLTLILVVAVFAAVASKTLVNQPRIVIPTFGLILVAISTGVMIYKWRVNRGVATLIGLALLGGLIVLGYYFPISFGVKESIKIWIVILLTYAFVASITPVNILLQPRDYLATFILFFGLILGYLGLVFSHPRMHTPAFVQWSGSQGNLWPMLFVIIACGAISGFHSLIASGTTSKQLANERDANKIAYGGMLMEGVLASLALLAVAAGLYWTGGAGREGLVYPELIKGGNWIVTFGKGFGQIAAPLLGTTFGPLVAIFMLKTFVMTTLDSGTRITRYLTEELFGKGLNLKIFQNRYFSTAVITFFAGYLAFGNWKAIWPIFGASNQLVAALALLVVTIYLWAMKKPTKYTIYPGIFVLLTTTGALIYQIGGFIRNENYLLAIIGVILLILAVFMVREGGITVRKVKRTLKRDIST
ncbi:MAG: carbon starvation protein A [bacterium]